MLMFDNLDWDDLKVFVHAARTGNLSAAAKRLKVDHSTVSRRISHLESALGHPVFERHPTGLRLSGFGERLLRHAERMESAVVSLQEEVAGEGAGLTGRVRLATMEGIASLYLARRLVRMRRRAPGLSVELVTSPQTISVNRREADLFLSFFRPSGQGLISERVGRFRLHVYGSEAYFEQHGRPKSPDELQEHVYVSYIEDLIQVGTVRWLEDIVLSPTVGFHSNSMIAQMNAAAGGLGLVVLPEFAIEGRSDLVPICPDRAVTTRELWLNVHTDLQYSHRIREVASFLKQTLREDAAMQVTVAAPQGPLDALPRGPGFAVGKSSGRSTVNDAPFSIQNAAGAREPPRDRSRREPRSHSR